VEEEKEEPGELEDGLVSRQGTDLHVVEASDGESDILQAGRRLHLGTRVNGFSHVSLSGAHCLPQSTNRLNGKNEYPCESIAAVVTKNRWSETAT
jgi:hypothetical protein